jgi:hypothetical protein
MLWRHSSWPKHRSARKKDEKKNTLEPSWPKLYRSVCMNDEKKNVSIALASRQDRFVRDTSLPLDDVVHRQTTARRLYFFIRLCGLSSSTPQCCITILMPPYCFWLLAVASPRICLCRLCSRHRRPFNAPVRHQNLPRAPCRRHLLGPSAGRAQQLDLPSSRLSWCRRRRVRSKSSYGVCSRPVFLGPSRQRASRRLDIHVSSGAKNKKKYSLRPVKVVVR